MDAIELLVSMTRLQGIYSRFCQPVCRRFDLGNTELAVLLFLANHPQYNTARDVCEKRLIKKLRPGDAVGFLGNSWVIQGHDAE